MKTIFSHSPIHGDLYFKSIYDYFDGPKLFSVITKKGKILLVYWTDETDDYYSWIAINISKTKLLALEKKVIDIHGVLAKKDDKIFFSIKTFFQKNTPAEFNSIVGDISDHILMPDVGIKISFVENVISNDETTSIIESSILESDYSVRIDKPKGSKCLVDFSMISPVFNILNELYSDFIDVFKLKDKLLPAYGKPGSFTLDFNSEKFNLIEKELATLSDLIKNRKDINQFITDKKIPSQALEKLFYHILDDNLVIDLTNKNTDEAFLSINLLDAEFYIKQINKLTTLNVSSQQVPQADLLSKVFEVVNNIWSNGYLLREDLNLSDRHILYYMEASKILGFVSETGSVTSTGQQLIMAPDEVKLSIAAQGFENSHCGWTWVMWSNVDNITEIKPNSAKAFLDYCAPTLSETTKDRRARTLRTWCTQLQSSYRVWN